MGQRAIRLANDKNIRPVGTSTLSLENGYGLIVARMIAIIDPPIIFMITGSMSLVRPNL